MSKFVVKVEHKPSFQRYILSAEKVDAELAELNVRHPFRLRDSYYFFISMEDWGKIFYDVLQNLPDYHISQIHREITEGEPVNEKEGWDFDCDNFGELCRTRVSEKYGINTCAYVDGESPWGYHGYNIFRAEDGWFMIDPQVGDVMEFAEAGYQPREALI